MLETPHVLVGAAIAAKVPNPLIAIPLAFVSHFVLEMVPHWNPHLNTEVKLYGKPTRRSTLIAALDSTMALVFGSIIAFGFLPNVGQVITVLACCFFAVLPDLLEAPYFYMNVRNRFIEKWISWQKAIQNDSTPIVGLVTQLVTIIASYYWIKS